MKRTERGPKKLKEMRPEWLRRMVILQYLENRAMEKKLERIEKSLQSSEFLLTPG